MARVVTSDRILFHSFKYFKPELTRYKKRSDVMMLTGSGDSTGKAELDILEMVVRSEDTCISAKTT